VIDNQMENGAGDDRSETSGHCRPHSIATSRGMRRSDERGET
jgi:hypothetical protein